jgi:hypothetical protein
MLASQDSSIILWKYPTVPILTVLCRSRCRARGGSSGLPVRGGCLCDGARASKSSLLGRRSLLVQAGTAAHSAEVEARIEVLDEREDVVLTFADLATARGEGRLAEASTHRRAARLPERAQATASRRS